MAKVNDMVGGKALAREVEVMGIADDEQACMRFDEVVISELADMGITNANALKVRGGIAYDTAKAVLRKPTRMTHRVFTALVTNLGLSREKIYSYATFNTKDDAFLFDYEYETVRGNVWILLSDFLKMDEERQELAVGIVKAMSGLYHKGKPQHVRACKRLDLQLDGLAVIRPEQMLEAVADDEWGIPRTRWAGDSDTL